MMGNDMKNGEIREYNGKKYKYVEQEAMESDINWFDTKCEGCDLIQKMIKSKASFEDIKKEFRHIEESVLKYYFDRIIRTQNNYLYDEMSNRY